MQNSEKQETIRYATYFVANQTTVRGVAKHFGVSKTHVHNKLSKMTQAKFGYEGLAASVRQLLDKNKQERHIRGGNATRLKYIKMK